MKHNVVLLFTSLSILVACGQAGEKIETREVVTSNIIAKDDTVWPLKADKYDSINKVRVIKYEMSEAQLAVERNAYRETDLMPFPIDPAHNTHAFRMVNVPEYSNIVFIPPKLWVYSHVNGGRTSPIQNADGTVTIDFPFVLTSGLEDKVLSPNEKDSVTVPENLRVKNYAGIAPGRQLAVLPGCPKKVVISFNNTEYDATPFSFIKGDYCDLNRPINASITLPKNLARYFLEKAIYNSAAKISVIYETKARFNKARVQIQFNRSMLWEELQIKTKGKYYWAEVDMRLHLRDIIKKQIMNVSIVGDLNYHINKIIDYAIYQFSIPFEKMTPQEQSQCDNGKFVACLKISYDKFKESSEFKLDWFESDTAMTGQNYVTYATLKPIADSVVEIGKGDKSEPLSNDNYREIMTVVSGDLLEITPYKIRKTIRHVLEPKTETKHTTVCVRSSEPERVCTKWVNYPCTKHGCREQNENSSRIKECERWEDRPGQCLQYENQWANMTTYGLSAQTDVLIENPIAQLNTLFTGMKLGFSWYDPAIKEFRTMYCPLAAFDYEADATKASIRLEDTEGCPVFERTKKNKVMLLLVNKMGKTIEFMDGRLVVNYKNETLERPYPSSYTPDVYFYGSVAIRGYAIWGATDISK